MAPLSKPQEGWVMVADAERLLELFNTAVAIAVQPVDVCVTVTV